MRRIFFEYKSQQDKLMLLSAFPRLNQLSLALLILWIPMGALAAEIRAEPHDGALNVISISGSLEAGDSQKFWDATKAVPKGLVVFSSTGGLLVEGLAIGEQIRLKGFASAVAENTLCASACALAWLGGRPRLMKDTSKIGFHAAYVQNGSYKRESGVANAVVGAYLTDMGLNLNAVRYITTPGPDEVQWLSVRDAIRIGIAVYSYESTLLASRADGPAVSSVSGGYETAQRAVTNFYVRFKSAGMNGMSDSVAACYKRAAELRTAKSVQYCFTIDLLAIDLSAWGKKTYNFPVLPYFTAAQANNRAHEILDSLEITRNVGEVLSERQDLMLLANLASTLRK
jgi:hypothetical protein